MWIPLRGDFRQSPSPDTYNKTGSKTHTLLMHTYQFDVMNDSRWCNACFLKSYSWNCKYPQKAGPYFTLLAEIELAAGRHVFWLIRVIFKEHEHLLQSIPVFNFMEQNVAEFWVFQSQYTLGRIWHGLSCIFRMSSYLVVLRFLKSGLYI